MSALLELAKLCEEATGPDRELDAMIAVAVDFVAENSTPASARELHTVGGGRNSYADIANRWPRLLRYTASLGAAMTLVPGGKHWTVATHPEGAFAIVCVGDGEPPKSSLKCASPALALCAAALRARAAQ